MIARRAWLVAALAAGVALREACAQVDMGIGVGPDALGWERSSSTGPAPAAVLPLALATSLAFDATTWAALKVSTETPARELTALLQRGYYKLEFLQLILMAKDSGSALKSLAEQRDKGKPLRELAKGLGLEYDAVYDRSLDLDGLLRARYLPSIMSVAVSTAPARGRRKKP